MYDLETCHRLLNSQLFGAGNIVLFEDERTAAELYPLAVMRPSWEIRCGAASLRERLAAIRSTGVSLLLRPRPELSDVARQIAGFEDDEFNPASDALFINGRLIGLWAEAAAAPPLPAALLDKDGRILLARMRGSQAQKLLNLPGNELAAQIVEQVGGEPVPDGWRLISAAYIWDYMLANTAILERELDAAGRSAPEIIGAHVLRDCPPGVTLTDRAGGHPVYVGTDVRLLPGAVLGNHAGPIWIGSRVDVEPHTYLEGPLFIGSDCRVKAGARFYHGCALGPHCRVAGEIWASVLQGYINKQHDGFLGNSILGEWVNIGADTRNSNLRNDYKTVRVQMGRKLVETGEQFIGLIMGDHTKTGINTMFNTGTVVGVGANVYGAGFPSRYIPSFHWGGAAGLSPWPLERILAAARLVMPRRGRDLTAAEEALLRRHYSETVNREKLS